MTSGLRATPRKSQRSYSEKSAIGEPVDSLLLRRSDHNPTGARNGWDSLGKRDVGSRLIAAGCEPDQRTDQKTAEKSSQNGQKKWTFHAGISPEYKEVNPAGVRLRSKKSSSVADQLVDRFIQLNSKPRCTFAVFSGEEHVFGVTVKV